MKSRLLLNVVIRLGMPVTIFELASDEDRVAGWEEYYLIVLDLNLDVIDSVRRLDFQLRVMVLPVRVLTKICMPASTKTKDKVKSRLLNVVIQLGMTIFKLVSGEDLALLVGTRRTQNTLRLRLRVIIQVIVTGITGSS